MGDPSPADSGCPPDPWKPQRCPPQSDSSPPTFAGLQYGSTVDGWGAVSTVTTPHLKTVFYSANLYWTQDFQTWYTTKLTSLVNKSIASDSVSLLLSRWSKVWTWDLPCMPREYLQKDNGKGFEVWGSDGETQWTDLPFCRVPHPRPGHRKAVEASRHVPLCYRVGTRLFIFV